MPLVHSNLLLEAFALSWKIVRCAPPHPCTISTSLTVPQRTMENNQAIESLAPRVKTLSKSLCAPVSNGDIKEESRRKTLGQ